MKPGKERRREHRHLCSEFIQLAWQDEHGNRASQMGVLEDVSGAGLAVSTGLPIAVGRAVHLHTRDFNGEAEVRYCAPEDDYGYSVGLEFTEGSGWDQSKWRPKHLYDPVTSPSSDD